MKYLLLFSFFFISVSTAFSQVYKGQWLGGGIGSFSHKTGDENVYNHYKSTQFSIKPDVGYFVINQLAVGVRPGYLYRKETQSYLDSLHATAQSYVFSIAPFARYYFLQAEKRVNIMADASYNWDWYTNKSDQQTEKNNLQSFTVSAGPVLFLSPYSALELSLSYTHMPHKGFYYIDNVSVNLGFQVHLGEPKKKHK